MKRFCLIVLSLLLVLGLGGVASATNGDNLIGIGPIARSMGGVGVAAPQDPVSAVFANPAAMCFGPYCPGSEFNFASTIFDPSVRATVLSPGAGINVSAHSQFEPFVVPAVGISTAVGAKGRFGLAAYGVSGLGVDYRNQLDFFPGNGAEGAIYTQLQIMKFAPNFAYLLTDNLSVGASLHVNYANLDLQQGSSHGYSMGVQLGTIYKMGPVSLGLSYVSPQKATHRRVYDFNGDGTLDPLKLESPQEVRFGVAYEAESLLLEGDVKWVNWADAEGFKDFLWDNQWVFAIGGQYKPVKKLALRAGFNYGKNPVSTHSVSAAAPYSVQGFPLSSGTFGFEYLRIIGFPAVVQSHLGLGVGYELTDKLALNLGYVHAFKNEVSETLTDFGGPGGPPVTLKSELSEDSYEFGLSWRF